MALQAHRHQHPVRIKTILFKDYIVVKENRALKLGFFIVLEQGFP